MMADNMSLSPMMPPAVTDIAVKGRDSGASPDMIQAELIEKSAKFPNLVPLASAFLVKSQLDQAQKAVPTPKPAPGNVMTDMLGQLSSLSAQRHRGLGGLPNPMMNNAQFAGGGIVAFANGDMVGDPHADDYLPRPNRNTIAAVEETAEAGVAAAPKGILSRGVSWAGKFIKNPYVIALSIGAPFLYNWLMGDDEEKKTEAANTLHDAQEGKKVDVSKYFAQAADDDTPSVGHATRMDTSGLRAAYGRMQDEYRKIADDPENKLTREQYTERAQQRREKAGIGKANEEELAYQKERSAKLDEREHGSLLRNIGLGLLTKGAEAAQSGATTGASLFAGIASGYGGYRNEKDKIEEMRDALRGKEFELKRNKEALIASDLATGDAQYDKAKSEIREANLKIADLEVNAVAKQLEFDMDYMNREDRFRIAQATANLSRTKLVKMKDKMLGAYIAAYKAGDTAAANEILERMAELTRAESGAVQAASVKAQGEVDKYAAIRNAAKGETGQTGSSGGKYEGFSVRSVSGG